MEKNYFITHIIKPDALPPKGHLKKLFFFTSTNEDLPKSLFFFGKGNNSFTRAQVNRQKSDGKLVELFNEERIDIEDRKGLWIDADGKAYYADLVKPNSDKIFVKDLN
ncbi:MAG: hypothetical protein AAF182_02355 [Pseudomonadota bacterium]